MENKWDFGIVSKTMSFTHPSNVSDQMYPLEFLLSHLFTF